MANPFNMASKQRAFDSWAMDQSLLDATAKHMNSKECTALYSTNRVFRLRMAPRKWNKVCFHDSEGQLVEQLSRFLSYPPSSKKYLHHHIKIASIIVLTCGPAIGPVLGWQRATDFPRGPPEVDGLPELILNAITSMTQLHTLTIDVWAFRNQQVMEFRKLLATRWKWRLNHLNVLACDDIVKDIINHCDSDELRGLHLYTGTNSVAWKAAKKHVRLDRLRLYLDGEVPTKAPTRSMNAEIIHGIAFLFPGIRWLVLCEEYSNYTIWNELRALEDKAEFKKQKDALANVLSRFVHLERFAFTLPKSCFANRFVHNDPAVTDFTNLSWHRWKRFLAIVVNDITKSAPRVREVCIFIEYPHLWQATRTKDGDPFSLNLRNRPPKPATYFPFGLLD